MAGRTRSLLGPELLWLLMSLAAIGLAAWNNPPSEERNRQLEVIALVLPLAGVLLSFVPFVWMRARWWLLARIAVTGAIGVSFVVTKLCYAIRYNDGRDPGIGTAWMLYNGLAFSLLILLCTIAGVALLVAYARQRRALRR
jgi:hypothetical protein